MIRLVRIALVTALLAVVVPVAASASPRMPIGFQDDPSFRWLGDGPNTLDLVQQTGASIVRAQANWSTIATTRPSNARSSFDKAYNLNDLDDMVRNAQQRGMEVMIAIWGTPKWANGGKGANVPPRNMRDLTNFAYALADRYSGKHAGYPFVHYWGVWNEPNLQIFLQPQFNAKGKIVSPATYAKIYKAAYAGIKAGSKGAKVAIGETSNQGRDHPSSGNIGDSVAPGTFARLLALQKGLRFDAYATHPYATRPNLPPTQKVRWPNVTLTQIPHFGEMLNTWFHRYVPIWITEYGYETKPAEPAGVTLGQQSAYMRSVLNTVKKNTQVQLFTWFVFHDNRQSLWQSGLLNYEGGQKPSFNTFSSLAPGIAGQTIDIKAGRAPSVELFLPRIASQTPPGTSIGVDYNVYDGGRLIVHSQAAPVLRADGSVAFTATFVPLAGKTYSIVMDANDPSGNTSRWTYSLVTPKAAAAKKKKK